MEIGKKFKGYFPTPCLSKQPCVYVSTIIIHIICEWHADARECGKGGKTVYRSVKNGKSGFGTYTFISKNRLKSLFLKITT